MLFSASVMHNAPLYAPTIRGTMALATGERRLWLMDTGGAVGRFTHGYDNYIRHAFPHDELKPLSLSHTDSLGAHAGYPLQRCLLHSYFA